MSLSRASTSARLRRTLIATVLIAGTASCSDTLLSAGPSPAVAENNADQLFEAWAARFNAVELAPKFEAARLKLAQSALVPSRIFDDSSVWEARPSANVRMLYVNGTTVNGHYRLESRPSLAPVSRLGDTRHAISLAQIAPAVFRWDTNVELATGGITAEQMSILISALLRAPEGRYERDLREDYRASVPRATATLARGFSLDTVRSIPGTAGTTNVQLTMSFHPDLMQPVYPLLAAYLDKYLGPAKYHFALSDRAGVPLFDIVGRDRAMTIRYRLQQGKLTSLAGPPKAWADSLVLRSDVSVKVKIFTVGFHNLLTDFIVDTEGHDRGWTVIARREPDWDLPFITERLIRTPLRRPFEGAGSLFRLSVSDSAGTPSFFVRRARLDVQESSIMRFIGSLASHALGELDTKVEVEEDRFLHDLFVALQADLHVLGGHWRADDDS